jgi:uncharacterized protein
MIRLGSLHVYPVKGASGIELRAADVLRGGLRHDRRFMVVDGSGAFLSQRAHPRLALVDVRLNQETLRVGASGAHVDVPLSPAGPRREVRVWNDRCEAVAVPGPASELLSEHLGLGCALVFMPDDVVRAIEAPHGRPGDRVGFADGYPVLLASSESLADLNRRLETPVAMSRFRPNVVVCGGAAYEEDGVDRVRIGGLSFRMPKRCARCEVVTVDPRTGERGKEPLRTLAHYRRQGKNVYFAQNLIPDGEGRLEVGDEVLYDSADRPLT